MALNILLVASIARFMFAQFVPALSVLLFILNVSLPLLQNDPNGIYAFVYAVFIVPIEY